MVEKKLCPVCGKVVGAWHKSGVHPSCAKKIVSLGEEMEDAIRATAQVTSLVTPTLLEMGQAIAALKQSERDKILRAITGPPKERTLRR